MLGELAEDFTITNKTVSSAGIILIPFSKVPSKMIISTENLKNVAHSPHELYL